MIKRVHVFWQVLLLVPAMVIASAAAWFSLSTYYSRNNVIDHPVTPEVASSAIYTIVGHGYGHGRGMGQWGAYGYSRTGWSAEQILRHYYGGTTLQTLPGRDITVRLMGMEGKSLSVSAPGGARVAGRGVAPGQAVILTPSGTGANVAITAGCGGTVIWRGTTGDPWVRPVAAGANRPGSEHLRVCATGTAYRGALGVSGVDGLHSINRVNTEDYLRGVVPSESPASWADSGGTQALRAQAVAARSYALAERRTVYAQTCDTTSCQVYGGSSKEDSRTNTAIFTTTGLTLTRGGVPVAAEFSSSTGGWSAGGNFPSVEDRGDSASPYHNWSRTITAGELARTFGVGEFTGAQVTSRNGRGAEGGRVLRMRVTGTTGVREVSGADARRQLGLRSDWFSIYRDTDPIPAPTPRLPIPLPFDLPFQIPPALLDILNNTEILRQQNFGGLHIVHDPNSPISQKLRSISDPAASIGSPMTPEIVIDGIGAVRVFSSGAIIYTPSIGAQVLDLSVLQKVRAQSGQHSESTAQ